MDATGPAADWLPLASLAALSGAVLCAALFARLRQRDRTIDALRAELARQSERARALIDETHDLHLCYDAAGRITSLDPQGAALLGIAEPGATPPLLGEVFDVRAIPPLLDFARADHPRCESGELLARTRSRNSLWLDARLRQIPDSEPARVELVASDITARKASESASALYAGAVQKLARLLTLQGSVESALETLSLRLGFVSAELWWVDPRRTQMYLRSVWHAPDSDLEQLTQLAQRQLLASGEGLAGRVWALGQTLDIDDLDDSPLERPAERTAGARSALAFPVRLVDRVEGAVVLRTRRPRSTNPPSPDLLDAAGTLLGQLAERESVLHRIEQNERRSRAVLDSTIDCVVTTDAQGTILEFNRAAERTFQWEDANAIGRSIESVLIPAPLRSITREGVRQYLLSGDRRLEGRIEATATRSDGRELPIEFTVSSSEIDGETVYTFFGRDITDRKEVERIQNELVSTVSHELRTPLSSVRGFVELLLVRDYPREEQRRFLEIIDIEIKRLTRLINDFLDLQRIEAGKDSYETSEHDLCKLLRECVELTAGSAASHRFELELPDAPLPVQVDADRMHQVLTNLLSNAVKFSPQGGTIYVRACEHGEHVEASVRDEGIGMPPKVVQKLFRKFYRADSSASRQIEGTGLGLALVREIVTSHGGDVSVESQPGVGSEFFVSLPLSHGGQKTLEPAETSASLHAAH